MSISDNPDQSVAYQIRGTFRAFETLLNRKLSDIDVSLAYFHVLRIQWPRNGLTQKLVAKKSFMTEGVASQVIKGLEKDGLVVRKSDPDDARIRRVCITPGGRRLRKKLIALGMTVLEDASLDLNPEHVSVVIEILNSLRSNLDEIIEKDN